MQHRTARRIGAYGVVLLTALSLVLVTADPATALMAPPPPIAVPGSVVAATGAGATTGEVVGGLTATGGVGTLATVSVAQAGVAGTVGVAAAGLYIGSTLGTQVARFAGLPTSGNVVCDAAGLFGSNVGCTTTAKPGYVVNADVTIAPAGYTGGHRSYGVLPYYTCGYSYCNETTKATIQYTVSGPPAGSPGVIVVDAVFTAVPNARDHSWQSNGYVYQRDATGKVTPFGLVGGITASPVHGELVIIDGAKTAGGWWYCSSAGTGCSGWDPASGPWSQVGLGAGISYVGEGTKGREQGSSGDPLRWWRTTWQCSVGAGGALLSEGFRESSPEWPGFPSATCDAGAITSVLVEKLTDGGLTTEITRWTAPDEYVAWASDPATQDCVGGGCQLLLERRSDPTSQRWLSCFANPSLCAQWLPETEAGSQEYRCTYAGVAVAIDECKVYGPTFSDGVYGDPTTGDPVPDPADPTDPSTPEDDACPPPFTWSSMVNPWWYYKGVACALSDAFVPKTDPMTQLAPLAAQASGKAPISWLTGLSDAFTEVPVPGGPSSCPDWNVRVGEDYTENVVCESSFIDALVVARPIITGMMLALAFYPLLRSIWYSILPVVRVTPTSPNV